MYPSKKKHTKCAYLFGMNLQGVHWYFLKWNYYSSLINSVALYMSSQTLWIFTVYIYHVYLETLHGSKNNVAHANLRQIIGT